MKRNKNSEQFIQRLAGLAIAAAGILSIPVTNNDITVALIFVPAGLYVAFSKDVIAE